MQLTDRASIPGHVVAREVGDETMLLDLSNGTYFSLDPVGTRIWQAISEGATLDEACAATMAVFEVPRERVEADVLALTAELCRRNLIRPV